MRQRLCTPAFSHELGVTHETHLGGIVFYFVYGFVNGLSVNNLSGHVRQEPCIQMSRVYIRVT